MYNMTIEKKHEKLDPMISVRLLLKKHRLAFFLLAILLFPPSLSADPKLNFEEEAPDQGGLSLPVYQEKTFIYFDQKTLSQRSRAVFRIEIISGKNPVQYTITSRGEGAFAEYQGVSWESAATLEVREGILYPLRSQGIVRDAETKEVLISKEKRFDYEQKQIIYKYFYSKSNAWKELVFPMKGLTLDSATLPFVLGSILAKGIPAEDISFYTFTESENLYRIAVQAAGIEDLSLSFGAIPARKYQLIPQLGALTWLGRIMGPPTYIWFSAENPFYWLQYKGYEVDFASEKILGQVQDRPGASSLGVILPEERFPNEGQ